MVSQDWLFLDRLVYLNMSSFIVFGILLYWGYYCIGLTFVLEVLSWIDKEGDS